MTYDEFLQAKEKTSVCAGIEGEIIVNPNCKQHQSRMIEWACRKGRALIAAGTGLGKTLMCLDIARIVTEKTGGIALIAAPLAVTIQTVNEGIRWGIPVSYVKSQEEIETCLKLSKVTGIKVSIFITNYQKLEHFDLEKFIAFLGDEASIMKDFTSKTCQFLIESLQRIRFRFLFSATPSPNDHTELGNYAEALGICTRTEMLTTYFVHDGETTQEWRLKGHARDNFWKWLCTWMTACEKPSDVCSHIGPCSCDDGYILPELIIKEHIIECAEAHEGQLFPELANTLTEQRQVKKATVDVRCAKTQAIVDASEPGFIVWCETNAESDHLVNILGRETLEMRGSMDDDEKESVLAEFISRDDALFVTKSSMSGHGLNLQMYHQMAFMNLTHSAERMYQAIRRCWRFGQTQEVIVHLILTDAEFKILQNYKRKVKEMEEMIKQLVKFMAEFHDLKATKRISDEYSASVKMHLPDFIGA